MSLINTTIWATVSMSTIKATPIWKEMAKKQGGKIPHEYHNTTLRAALVMLGMSTDGHYTVERGVNIRSNNNRRVVFANTTLYTFPVRQDYKYKRIYQGVDILHFGEEDFTGWGSSHIKMEDFGNEHDPSRDDDSEF